jgi:transposase
MLEMTQVKNIRDMYHTGKSVAEIARSLKVSEPTVRKYVGKDDFNAPLPVKETRPSKLDPYKEVLTLWYEEDKVAWHKQRHTAQRAYDRLKEETGFDGSYALVQRYVKELKSKSSGSGYLDLVWPPGSMQVDFGQADIDYRGKRCRIHYLVATFPYSNAGFAQIFFAENAECVCEGLVRIFAFAGGVPIRCVFDNATGIGRRIMHGIKLTDVFGRFQLHYGFEVSFCNPNSGHEKGNVENKVGTLRRNLFVPIPKIDDLEAYNAQLLDECMDRAGAIHYRKGERGCKLFERDKGALRPLPAKPFFCIRYETYKTDKTGNVIVDGKYRYSTSPSLPMTPVIVGFKAFGVDIYDDGGKLIASHPRLYADGPDESIDPAASLRLLSKRPGAWGNSRVRLQLPHELVEHIDGADPGMLKTYMDTIASAADETDYATAIKAAHMVYLSTGQIRRTDVTVYAARLYGGDGVPYDEPVDLSGYDAVFAKSEVIN